VGTERLIVGIRQADGAVLGSPEEIVDLEVQPADDPSAQPQRAQATFTWIVPDVVGLYRAVFMFDRPGVWQATVIPQAGPPLEPALFSVLDPACRQADRADPGVPGCAVQVGEPAPTVATYTTADRPLEEITTDPSPDPRLYEHSLDTLVANGRPTVIIFATPAFCTSAACGPLLDEVKAVVDDYSSVDFIHVEVYERFRDDGFDPANPEYTVDAIFAYRLPSEPWVYVVDGDGIVTARFEGVMDAEELVAALET